MAMSVYSYYFFVARMAKHNTIGKSGEDIARKYLESNDYLILETNWREGRLECDIIAYKDNHIVFVEVKTRSSEEFGSPEQFVDKKKQLAYIRLANAYVLQKKRTEEAQFDIISVVNTAEGPVVRHIPNAFTTVV